MAPTAAAQERAMKFKDVIVRAMGGELTWWQAADILGVSARTMRRWRFKYQRFGVEGLQDRRRVDRSPHAVRAEVVKHWIQIYRERYRGYNVRHFYARLRREEGCKWSYTVVRRALQAAGLVKKKRPRGRHFIRREPRACFGELLHIDGSRHRWLTLCPDQWQSLIVVVDDATKRVLYAQLGDGESTHAILTALAAVVGAHGIPQTLYSDRASWATFTAKAGQPVDRTRRTQVGRALERLGVEHLLAYSPQARGRSERVNRTLQDRLVKELHTAGIRTLERANRYLNACFLPAYNDEFARPPAHPDSGFAPLGAADLAGIFCHEETRTVQRDNTVTLEGVRLQIAKQPGRTTCAGLEVTVRRHLDGTHTIAWGPRLLGRYSAQGRALSREPFVHATPTAQPVAVA
jgi:transposase